MRHLLVLAVVLLGACKDDPAPLQQPDAPTGPGNGAPDAAPLCTGGTLGYLEKCDPNASECGSCECHYVHDFVCDLTCTMDSECPPPSRGCSPDGYCRD